MNRQRLLEMKALLAAISILLLAGCATDRKDSPEKIIIREKPVVRVIPDSFLVCSPPPVVHDELIEMAETEQPFNEELVIPLFVNNEECYMNMNRIIRWNEQGKEINSTED